MKILGTLTVDTPNALDKVTDLNADLLDGKSSELFLSRSSTTGVYIADTAIIIDNSITPTAGGGRLKIYDRDSIDTAAKGISIGKLYSDNAADITTIDADLNISLATDKDFKLFTNVTGVSSTNRLTVLSTGNVGINKANPTAKLQVHVGATETTLHPLLITASTKTLFDVDFSGNIGINAAADANVQLLLQGTRTSTHGYSIYGIKNNLTYVADADVVASIYSMHIGTNIEASSDFNTAIALFINPISITGGASAAKYGIYQAGVNDTNLFNGVTTFSNAFTLSAITNTINIGGAQTSGVLTLGGALQTGNITIGRSTATHTLNIDAEATTSDNTKTINIGTGGVTGSTTTITYGSSIGTTHTFNGNVSGITKAMVGLGNVNNTTDANKPISTATQTALNTKVSKVTSTDNALVRFDETTGDVQNSLVTVDDGGAIFTKRWVIGGVPAGNYCPIMSFGADFFYGVVTSGTLTVNNTNDGKVTSKVYAVNLMGHGLYSAHLTLLSQTDYASPCPFDVYDGLTALGSGSSIIYFLNRDNLESIVTFTYRADTGAPTTYYTDKTATYTTTTGEKQFFTPNTTPNTLPEPYKATFGSAVMHLRSANIMDMESGRVLIGKTTDDGINKLQVEGGVSVSGNVSGSSFTVKTVAAGSRYIGIKEGAGYGDGVSGATFKSITDNPYGGSYAFAAYFNGETGTNSFFVAADGTGYFKSNVGIDTPTPTEKLHVVGNVLATGTVTGSNIFTQYHWSFTIATANTSGCTIRSNTYNTALCSSSAFYKRTALNTSLGTTSDVDFSSYLICVYIMAGIGNWEIVYPDIVIESGGVIAITFASDQHGNIFKVVMV